MLAIFFIYKTPQCSQPRFKSVGLLIQEMNRKIDFQDGHHSGHTGFSIGTNLAISDLQQVTLMLPAKFQISWPFGFGEEAKNKTYRFLSTAVIITIFDLQVTSMLPTEIQVYQPFSSGEETRNRFSRHGGHFGFPIGTILTIL